MNRRNIFKSFLGLCLAPYITPITKPPAIPSMKDVAGTRRLEAKWTIEAEQDPMRMHSIFPDEKSLTSSSDMV